MALPSGLVRRVKALFTRGEFGGETAVQLRDAVATQGNADAAELARRLGAKEITLKQFQSELYLMTRNAHIAQYALARGGVGAMTDADRATLGRLIGTQADYLRDFTAAIGKGELTQEEIARRASLYPESAIEASSRGQAAALGLDLPQHPPAHPGCRCGWAIDGAEATWQTAEDEQVCPVCTGLADQYSPWTAAA